MGSSCLLQPLQAGQPGSHCGRQQVHNRLYNSSDYVYLIWELLYIIAVLTLMGINVNSVIPEINAVFY